MAKTVHSKVVVSAKDNVTPSLNKLQTRFRIFAKSAQSLGRTFKTISAVSFAGFAGGLTASLAIAKNAVKAFSDYGTAVDNTSRSLSIATGSLQAFRYAADLGGSSASEMDGAIAMLNKNMANAAAGQNKNLVKLMGDLGISMRDANGNMKTAAELIPEIADCIKSQTDSTQKAYIATQFFGRSGQNLIKTLNDGSEGLIKAREEAEHFGLVLSDEDVAAATKFGDSMTRTEKALQGVKNTIGSKLMPVLQPMLDGFNEWIATNREILATLITDAVYDLSNALKDIDFKSLLQGFIGATKSAVSFFKAIGGIKTVAIALGAVLAGQTLVGIVSAAGAFLKVTSVLWTLTKAVWGFNASLLANPITWIVIAVIAGIAAIAGAVYLIYDNWGAICDWFSDMWEKIKGIFTGFWDWYKNLIQSEVDIAISIFDGFVTFFTETIPNSIKSAWSNLKDWFLGLIDTMLGPAKGIIDTVSSVTGAVGNGLSSAWDGIAGFFGGGNQTPATAGASPLSTMVDNRFNGALEIKVKTDAGVTSEVTDQRSDNRNMAMKVTQNKGASR